MKMRSASAWVLILVAIALVLARLRWGAELQPRALVCLLRGLATSSAAVPMFLLLYASGTSLLLPAVGFHIVAAVVWGYWPGFGLSMVALNLTAGLHFLAGRRLGRARVEAFLARRGWTGALVSERGVTTMIAVRQLPLPFVAVNLAAGASPLKAWHFAVGSALGAVPPTLTYTWFAVELVDGVEQARTEALVRALLAGSLILLLALAPRLWAWLRARRDRAPAERG